MSEIKTNITKLGKKVTTSSNKLIKNIKTNLKLNSAEEKLKKLYLEIGQKVHEIYAYGGSIGKFFDEKYLEIAKIEEQINELKSLLAKEKVKNVEVIQDIKKVEKLEIPLEESTTYSDTNNEEEIKCCSYCNEKILDKSVFCPICGRKL